MTSPAAFIAEALAYARQAHAETGVLTSVILAQWAAETAWGGEDWSPNNNPGNVGSFDGQPVATFPTLAEGVAAYIQLMNEAPQFGPTIRKQTTYEGQCFALGNAHPVWALAGYRLDGGAPGSMLVSIIQSNDLTQYDAPTPAPTPTPVPPLPPIGDDGMFGELASSKEDNLNATIRYLWGQIRSDQITPAGANFIKEGYLANGSIDLVVAAIIDGAQKAGTLRPTWAGAV